MNFTVAGMSATAAIGVYFLLSFAISIELWRPDAVLRYLRSDHIPRSSSAIFVAVIGFIAGMLLQSFSDLVDDQQVPFMSTFPAELDLRSQVFKGRFYLQYAASPLAIASLKKSGIDTSALEKNTCPDRNTSELIYYMAKNVVFSVDTYSNELCEVQSRITFGRAFTLASLLQLPISLLICGAVCLRRFIFPLEKTVRGLRPFLMSYCLLNLFFFTLYVIGRFSYSAEEIEFDKRVFGYYLGYVSHDLGA